MSCAATVTSSVAVSEASFDHETVVFVLRVEGGAVPPNDDVRFPWR